MKTRRSSGSRIEIAANLSGPLRHGCLKRREAGDISEPRRLKDRVPFLEFLVEHELSSLGLVVAGADDDDSGHTHRDNAEAKQRHRIGPMKRSLCCRKLQRDDVGNESTNTRTHECDRQARIQPAMFLDHLGTLSASSHWRRRRSTTRGRGALPCRPASPASPCPRRSPPATAA